MYESATLKEDVVDWPKLPIEPSSELKDISTIGLNYTDLTTPKLKEDTFGDRLKKSRLELGLSISQVAKLCGVTDSVVSGYEGNRYNPTKEILTLLSSTFDIDYLCMDGYTKLVYNFDKFLDKLRLWMNENNYTRDVASNNLGVSRSLLRYWFNGGVIKISTYNNIHKNLVRYNLI